ncbi:MAG: hypothetical protein KGJ86_13345 [Chloroflexota bacterium]|nr:hypothetical protein [Chloroflexota bacterium]
MSDTGKTGYGGILSIGNSCSTAANPTHRRMTYNIATDGFVQLGVGVSSHIEPAGKVGDLVNGNGGKLGDITPGDYQVAGCYDPTHVHFGVQRPSMSEVGGPWENRNVSAGVDAPWEKYI